MLIALLLCVTRGFTVNPGANSRVKHSATDLRLITPKNRQDIDAFSKSTIGITLALEANHAVDLLIDTLMAHPPGCHTQVAVKLDQETFWDLVVDALERIGEVN